MRSLLCDYTTDVPLPALHEAIKALDEVKGKTATNLYDKLRWFALEGEPYTVSDVQPMLTTKGVLSRCEDCQGGSNYYPLPGGHGPTLAASGTTHELLLQCNPVFWRICGKSFRTRLRQLRGLTVADQVTEFRGTQFSKLVVDPISQRLPSQLRFP